MGVSQLNLPLQFYVEIDYETLMLILRLDMATTILTNVIARLYINENRRALHHLLPLLIANKYRFCGGSFYTCLGFIIYLHADDGHVHLGPHAVVIFV